MLQAEDVPTSSLVIPVAIGIKSKLDKSNTIHCTSLKTGLTMSFDKRLGSVTADPQYVTSAVLSPRFKMKWVLGATEEDRVKVLLLDSLDKQQASKNSQGIISLL